jgi:hypothetical protein
MWENSFHGQQNQLVVKSTVESFDVFLLNALCFSCHHILKLIFVKLTLPGDPRVDLEGVDPIVDAVDTATSMLSVFFKGVETLALTSFMGVDLL